MLECSELHDKLSWNISTFCLEGIPAHAHHMECQFTQCYTCIHIFPLSACMSCRKMNPQQNCFPGPNTLKLASWKLFIASLKTYQAPSTSCSHLRANPRSHSSYLSQFILRCMTMSARSGTDLEAGCSVATSLLWQGFTKRTTALVNSWKPERVIHLHM